MIQANNIVNTNTHEELSKLATIIIPTRNRSWFLRRLLAYLSYQKCLASIIVADSSDDGHRKTNLRTVDDFADTINIEYLELSNLKPDGLYGKIAFALSRVTSEFVVICADDDFVVPNAVGKCVQFLRGNPDYSCARGYTFVFEFETDRQLTLRRAPVVASLDSNSREARLLTGSRHYQQVFSSVFRRDVLVEIEGRLSTNIKADCAWLAELAVCFFAATLGKVGRLSFPYEYRQKHSGTLGLTVPRWPETIFGQGTALLVQEFKGSLALILQRFDVPLIESQKLALSSLCLFSKYYFTSYYKDKHYIPGVNCALVSGVGLGLKRLPMKILTLVRPVALKFGTWFNCLDGETAAVIHYVRAYSVEEW